MDRNQPGDAGATSADVAAYDRSRLIASTSRTFATPAGKRRRLIAGERSVLLALDSFSRGGRRGCYPSVAAIARRTGFSVRSVHRHLDSLAVFGVVVATPRYDENGRQKSNEYAVEWSALEGGEGVTVTPWEGDTVTGGRVTPWQGGGCHRDRGEGVTVTPPTRGRANSELQEGINTHSAGGVCVQFVRRIVAGLHQVDGDAGPLFRYEPTERETGVAAELLETLGNDGGRLLAAVAPMLVYVKSRFSTCAKFGGAVDHLRAWAAKAVAGDKRRAAAAAENGRRAAEAAQQAAAARVDAERLEAFRRLPAGDVERWRGETVRKFPALAGLARDGPSNLVDQLAAGLWNDGGKADG
jgi:hypothetical protein